MRNDQGLMFHLLIKEGDIGRYVLMPGDPGRVAKIASFLEDTKPVAQHREYTTYTGSLLGEKVSVISTGIGCPSTAIAVEEAIEAGADTMIRVGTSGSMQPDIHTGDLAVITGAIRDEGTTRAYLPLEFPAVASLDVVNALIEGCKTLGVPFYSGISHSKDSFYGEVERTRMPMAELLGEKWDAYVKGGAVCSEMEAAALFILAGIYRKRAGAVTSIINSNDLAELDLKDAGKKMETGDENRVIRAAVEGLKVLIKRDKGR
jgi:uridine phosphorylase